MEERFPRVCGLPMPRGFSVEVVSSAINYKPKPEDIFVVSYPKCGTTWLQKIVLLLLRKGKPSHDPLEIFFDCPYLELSGTEALDCVPKPLAIKTHLPYHLAPISPEAKYLHISRNPLDCAVSFYHHLKNLVDITFDEYMELVFSGNSCYGDYIDHLIGWYKHKDDPNVLLVVYEDLKRDARGEILKIANFIGQEYWELLKNEPSLLDDIVRFSSFEYMRKETNEVIYNFWKGEMDAGDRVIPTGLRKVLETRRNDKHSNVAKDGFLRKGEVGDWKNHFSAEQKRKYEARIAEKTVGCDVMSLWKDIMKNGV